MEVPAVTFTKRKTKVVQHSDDFGSNPVVGVIFSSDGKWALSGPNFGVSLLQTGARFDSAWYDSTWHGSTYYIILWEILIYTPLTFHKIAEIPQSF
jgi:hypothetical protein